MQSAQRQPDRRRRRSDECRTAIHFQLLHLAERYDLQNLVLADNAGIMLACAKNEEAGRALAAYAPVFKRHLDRGSRAEVMGKLGELLPDVDGQTLSVRRFRLGGEDHFLCVVAEQRLARHANLYRGVTGIRRIVEQTSSVELPV